MAKICSECGASNQESDSICRSCGGRLTDSGRRPEHGNDGRGAGPWVVALLIAILVLCCLALVGVALLDELIPDHPFRSLVMGSPTATATLTPEPTRVATLTPVSTPATGGDAFEPDDTMAQASTIETDGTPQSHTLSPPGDVDYVSFRASAGKRYTVETGNLGFECDTVLTLYDEDGTELARDDDGSDESLASLISWTARESGTLFAQVRHFDELAEGEDTEFDIWVSESEDVVLAEDEYEPDDVMEQANELALDVPQTHSFHVQGDEDWLFFEAEEGTTYGIETADLEGGADTIIYLYDEDGVELAHNDDGGADSLASRITWTARADAGLHVMARDYSDEQIESLREYTIWVTANVPVEPDAYEPDNSQDQAGQIEVGSQQDHNLHTTADHDWVCFQVTSGTEYVVETFNLGESIDTYLALYDLEGVELAEDDDSGAETLASLITWRATESADLCVMVRELGDDEAGPGTEYTLSVAEAGAVLLTADEYEPDDTMATAGEIEIGEVQPHNVHKVGDHDWLTFQAMQGTTYVVETYSLGLGIDTVVVLYDEDGVELAQDDDGADEPRASRVVWTSAEEGPVYVMVRDYKDTRADRDMTYAVSINEGD